MMNQENKTAQFYFANLGADVMRCVVAARDNNEECYKDSIVLARRTLTMLRDSKRPEAYEEGRLLLEALEYSRRDNTLEKFSSDLNKLISQTMILMA